MPSGTPGEHGRCAGLVSRLPQEVNRARHVELGARLVRRNALLRCRGRPPLLPRSFAEYRPRLPNPVAKTPSRSRLALRPGGPPRQTPSQTKLTHFVVIDRLSKAAAAKPAEFGQPLPSAQAVSADRSFAQPGRTRKIPRSSADLLPSRDQRRSRSGLTKPLVGLEGGGVIAASAGFVQSRKRQK
jgi:hypothetical protein